MLYISLFYFLHSISCFQNSACCHVFNYDFLQIAAWYSMVGGHGVILCFAFAFGLLKTDKLLFPIGGSND